MEAQFKEQLELVVAFVQLVIVEQIVKFKILVQSQILLV